MSKVERSKNRDKADGVIVSIILMLLFVAFLLIADVLFQPIGRPISASCISHSGFFCGNLRFSLITGNIMFAFGQNTNEDWTSWALLYAPEGTPMAANAPALTFNPQTRNIVSSQQVSNITLAAASPNLSISIVTEGAIWVCYSTTATAPPMVTTPGTCYLGTNTFYYAQAATLSAKAT